MSNKDNTISVKIKEWYDNVVIKASGSQRELTRLTNEFAKSGLPIPDKIKDITPDYVKMKVEEGRTMINGNGVYLPLKIKEANDREFNKVLETYVPIAEGIQSILKENPYTVRKTNNGLEFDDKEVASKAEEKSIFVITGEHITYLKLLQSVASAIENARTWEKEHGWIEFAGRDDVIPLPDGRLFFSGFAQKLKDSKSGKFGFTPVKFAELLIHGDLGEIGEL